MMRHLLFLVFIGAIILVTVNAVDAQVVTSVVPFCSRIVAASSPGNLTACGNILPPGTTCLETDSQPTLLGHATTPGQNAGEFFGISLLNPGTAAAYWITNSGPFCGVFSDFCLSSTTLVEGLCVTGSFGIPLSALPGSITAISGIGVGCTELGALAVIDCTSLTGVPHPVSGVPMQGVCNPNPAGTGAAACI